MSYREDFDIAVLDGEVVVTWPSEYDQQNEKYSDKRRMIDQMERSASEAKHKSHGEYTIHAGNYRFYFRKSVGPSTVSDSGKPDYDNPRFFGEDYVDNSWYNVYETRIQL